MSQLLSVSFGHWRASTVDVLEFIAGYTSVAGEARIRFDWNGQYAEGFVDRNAEVRDQVREAVLADVSAAPLELVRDLFLAETLSSRKEWGIVDGVGKLAEALLRRGGAAYLDDYLEGKCQSIESSLGSAFEYDLPLARAMLAEVRERLRLSPDSPRARLWQQGEELFTRWVADCEQREAESIRRQEEIVARTPRFWGNVLVLIGCLINAAAWFLPVEGGFPGWFAFMVALSPVWVLPYELLTRRSDFLIQIGVTDLQGELRYYGFCGLSVLSALSNTLVLGWFFALRTSPRLSAALGWACLAAFLLNGWWLLRHAAVKELQIGYYLWWLSFALLAVGWFAKGATKGKAKRDIVDIQAEQSASADSPREHGASSANVNPA